MASPAAPQSGKILSLQVTVAPIAKQVSDLEKLLNSRRGHPVPDVGAPAAAIRESACKLQRVAISDLSKYEDGQLKVDLPMACDAVVKASEQLVEAARRLRQQPTSRHAKTLLFSAAKNIRTDLVQVLLHWDDAEVRRMCHSAQVARDRLQLMSACNSMRSLVLCFRSFAEAMKELLHMADKRQKELVDRDRKRKLLESLDKMKQALPKFSSVMQVYVKSHSPASKEKKDKICEGIAEALDEFVACVRDESGAQGLARNIMEVKRKLGTSKRYSIGPELDRHIDAIIENSKAVAHVSHDEYREMILRECGEVLTLRKELGTHFEAVTADPGSARAKRAFDKCTKKLCKKLNELDRWVADSVVDQVTDAFVETSKPIDHLVRAATAHRSPQRVVPAPPTSKPAPPPTSARPRATNTRAGTQHSQQFPEEDVDAAAAASPDTKHMAEVFRRHSRRLSQVAVYAAQSSTDAERIKLIKDLANAIDELTSVVVEKAERVSKNPGDRQAKEELDTLRRKWASKVQELTQVIDDIIDPEDFMAQSEVNIQQDMEKCQAAIQGGKWEELRKLVLAIAAKARRALEVGETAVSKASDHTYKATLSSAVSRLEKAIPKIVSTANKVMEDPSSQEKQDSFIRSLQEVLDSLHHIQSVLGTEIDITSEDETPPPPRHGFAHLRRSRSPDKKGTSAQEWTRNMKQAQAKPLYIGSLGANRGQSARIAEQQGLELSDSSAFQEEQDSSLDLSRSHDSMTQTTPPPPRREQSSQFGNQYLSTNATLGSPLNPDVLSPESSTSTWRTPLSPVYMSPVRRAPPSPVADMPPPFHVPPSPPPTSPPRSPLCPSPPTTSPPRDLPTSPSPAELVMSSYVSPFQKVISAATRGDPQQLSNHASDLSARVIRLTGMADSAASALDRDTDLVKVIQTKSSTVQKLTPRILDQADLVSRTPHHRQQKTEFDAITHQWAGNVRDLINAMQQANLPWSHRVQQLMDAAESGEGLESQMEHISSQTRKMVDVATMAIEAAQTEEAIGAGGDTDLSVDRELQEQVKLVRTKMSEIEKLTPQLLGAAEMATGQPLGSAASEHLHLLAQEWATKAKVLMKGVDDITLGMGGAADTLFLAAKSGDAGLQKQQSKAINNLASSLQTIAKEAMEGCEDEEKVKVVQVVARRIDKLSTRLVECADHVAQAMAHEEGQPDQTVQEDTEILRRDWSSQVHLLTAHVDDLTAETSAPLDRLVDISLQANRTSGRTKELLLSKFEAMATYLTSQLNQVDRLFEDATQYVGNRDPAVGNAGAAIGFLKKLTPHAVGAAKGLESDAGSAMLEHFNHLRRQWAAKAQFLLANLKKTRAANMDEVIDAFMELLHNSHVTSPSAHPDQHDMLDYSSNTSDHSVRTLSPMHRSYSSEVIGSTTPVTRFDFDDSEFRSSSTSMALSESRESSSSKKKQYIPSLSEMGLRHVTPRVKRPTSMAVPLPSWAVADTSQDIDSANSIALAAHMLRELTDEFLEENNPLVTVGKKMSEQMSQMAEFTRGKGELQNKMDMIFTAKAVALNGQTIHKIANLISKQCVDERSKNNLLCCAEMIPTLSTQLTILASVKTATPDDISADVMLVKNAQNLMQAVIKTVRAAEAACMKGLKPGANMLDEEDQGTVDLAMNWKRKLYHQRAKESISAPRGARGLRKLNKYRMSTPSAVDVIKPSEADMKSPTKY